MMKHTLSNLAMYTILNQRILTTKVADREKAEELETAHNAAKGSFAVTQKLVPRAYIKDLDHIRQAARNIHNALTIPTDVRGLRILPTTLFEKHADAMTLWSGKHLNAYKVLEDSWDSIVEHVVPTYIGRELRPNELPATAQLPLYFNFEVSYRQIPDNFKDWRLEGVTPDDADYIRRYAENETFYMWEEAMKEVFAKAHVVIEGFVESVKKPDGKGLSNERTMDNIREFAEVLKGMNIWQNASLDEAYAKMKEFVDYSAKDLRDDETLRNNVAQKSESIKELLAKYR